MGQGAFQVGQEAAHVSRGVTSELVGDPHRNSYLDGEEGSPATPHGLWCRVWGRNKLVPVFNSEVARPFPQDKSYPKALGPSQ